MAALGCTEEFLRWECSLCDVLRWRHAQLWSDGHRCRRAGQVAARIDAKRRQRFDTVAALYARH